MSFFPFTISLKPGIELLSSEGNLLLCSVDSERRAMPRQMSFPDASLGLKVALEHLMEGSITTNEIKQLVVVQGGAEAGEQIENALHQMVEWGWICYSVLPLAIAVPMVEEPEIEEIEIDWQKTTFTLSRFAYLHQREGSMVLESPLSTFRITLLDLRTSAIIAQLSKPQPFTALGTVTPDISSETVQQLLELLLATKFLSIEPGPPPLQLWEFHDLLFHGRSRPGRHDYPVGGTEQFWDRRQDVPVTKPPMGDKVVPLFRPNLDLVAQNDLSLTQSLEFRQSIREYGDFPLTIEQLGELLYRSARVKEIYESEFDLGELSRRPYPAGGGMYELEIYPVIHQCEGLNTGLFHYDPLHHQLEQIADYNPDVIALLTDAYQSSGEQDMPQVLLVITARFGRLFWKYRSLAYSLVLKHVGVLYQTLYLVATSMGLAPCALGTGNSNRFAKATGLDYYEESSVGEFMLGSLPSPAHPRSTAAVSSTSQESALSSSTTAVTPSSTFAHDLDARIFGLSDLREQTLGDSRITIVILDGNADLDRACFQGADVTKVFPYWHEPPEAIAPEYYKTYLSIEKSGAKGEEKTKKLKEAIPEPILKRISGDCHATHIISTIIGQPDSPAPGIAPRCRAINIPLNSTGEVDETISPLNLARAFELALELGANIIHCAFCCPTQTGVAHDLLTQAVKKCLDNNILIVAPSGNNKGECWCIPAIIPGVLAVGAMKDDGQPFKFSNWGGNHESNGILAPGENILGAQPSTDEPQRKKGTSCAAPVVTGISALLLSMQLQQGKSANAEAVCTALLNSAIPCDPNEVEEPERCLRGKINVPGAMKLLFGQPSVTTSFTGEQMNLVESSGEQRESPERTISEPEVTVPRALSISETTIAPSEHLVSAASGPEVQTEVQTMATATFSDDAVTPSATRSNHVYALGTLGYDFGTEARRDTFKQLMPTVEIEPGVMSVPANPYDARQMVDYLDQHPEEGHSLIWTLNLELTPIYAIEPKEGFAFEVYETLYLMLAGQIEPEDSDDYIERVSIPAQMTNRTVELFSGQIVPVIEVINTRGMYGWKVNALVDAALAIALEQAIGADEEILRLSLVNFLNRIYYDLRNLGQTARDRAMNFAATNAFQAASSFAEAVALGMELEDIKVEKSPFCRLHSDCWDVKLKFFDPENSRRAKKVYRFTIDVLDLLPVTLGEVKSWSVPR